MTITQTPHGPAHTTAGPTTWAHGRSLFAVTRAAASGIEDLFAGCTAWIALPARPQPTEALPSRLALLVKESRSLTGWSQRDLAVILGTSHTTVRRLETEGRISPRTRDTAARAAQLHGVLARLARLTSSREQLATVLATPGPAGTPADLLRSGDWPRAYLAALDALRPPVRGMLRASPAPALPATRELQP